MNRSGSTRNLSILSLTALAVCGLAGTVSAQTLVSPVLSTRVQPGLEALHSGVALRDFATLEMAIESKSARDLGAWQAAVDYVRRNPAGFRAAVRRSLEDQAAASSSIGAGDPAYVAAALALRASDDFAAAEDRDSAPAADRDEIHTSQLRLAEMLRDAMRVARGFPFLVFASGSVTESLGTAGAADDDGATPIGSGSLGLSVQTDAGRFTGKVNLISSDAVAGSDIGPAVLSPGTGNALASALLDFRAASMPRLRAIPGKYLPNHFYVSTSGLRIRDGAADDAPIVRATVLGAGALWSKEIVNDQVAQTSIVLSVEAGPAMRWVDGDIVRASSVARLSEGFHPGVEAGFSLAFGRIVAGAQLYHLYATNGAEPIDGLDGLQFVAGISVTGEFFEGTLRP